MYDSTRVSLAYSRPRLGIEWIVQVFTGEVWQYGRCTRYGGNGVVSVLFSSAQYVCSL